MYFADFFKKLGRKSNIPVFIYLAFNVAFISLIASVFFEGQPYGEFKGFVAGLVFYGLSLVIALSSVGEWILRKQQGCKPITNPQQKAYLEPIFQEVYAQAKAVDPALPDGIKFYINDDNAPNAFATGRKTVCITKGLMTMSREHIRAVIAHEFGHLSHKDTDLILVVAVGNMIVAGIILAIRAFLLFFRLICGIVGVAMGGVEGRFMVAITFLYQVLIDLLVVGATWLWTKIGTLLVMKASRDNEFEADAFAAQLGYAEHLDEALDIICANEKRGLFANLVSSHPEKEIRLARLKELNATAKTADMGLE